MLCYKNKNIFNHVEKVFSKTYEMNFVNINFQKLYNIKIDVKFFFDHVIVETIIYCL